MANKDGSKAVSEMNIKEFMVYVDEQYNIVLPIKMLDNYISFLDGFMIVFPSPEKFEQIRNILRDVKGLMSVIERYSK